MTFSAKPARGRRFVQLPYLNSTRRRGLTGNPGTRRRWSPPFDLNIVISRRSSSSIRKDATFPVPLNEIFEIVVPPEFLLDKDTTCFYQRNIGHRRRSFRSDTLLR